MQTSLKDSAKKILNSTLGPKTRYGGWTMKAQSIGIVVIDWRCLVRLISNYVQAKLALWAKELTTLMINEQNPGIYDLPIDLHTQFRKNLIWFSISTVYKKNLPKIFVKIFTRHTIKNVFFLHSFALHILLCKCEIVLQNHNGSQKDNPFHHPFLWFLHHQTTRDKIH